MNQRGNKTGLTAQTTEMDGPPAPPPPEPSSSGAAAMLPAPTSTPQHDDGAIAPVPAATAAAGPSCPRRKAVRGPQALGALGAGVVLVSSIVGGLLGGLGKRRRRAEQRRLKAGGAAAAGAKAAVGPVVQEPVLDLTPFGSPAVGTPIRLTVGTTSKVGGSLLDGLSRAGCRGR